MSGAQLPPLVSIVEASKILGIHRATLWGRTVDGEIPVVHTGPRKRFIPARHFAPYRWEGGSLTRREFAAASGMSYSAVVRSIVSGWIPVSPDQRVPSAWIDSLTSQEGFDELEAITEITF